MSKSATVRARIEPKLKSEVEELFKELGLSVTDAINIFYRQVKLMHGLPFSVRIPNAETLEAIRKADKGEDLVYCDSAEDMFEKLSI